MTSEAPSADAKKADGARLETLLNPRPLDFTGSVACSHDESPILKKLILEILETMDIRRLSQDTKSGDVNAGDVRRICRSLGMENE
jgi:hypothetical protein